MRKSDKEFLKLVKAVIFISDQRQKHIKVYKRLVKIIESQEKK